MATLDTTPRRVRDHLRTTLPVLVAVLMLFGVVVVGALALREVADLTVLLIPTD